MRQIISSYRELDHSILYAIIVEFFLQLVNAAMILILLIYMEKVGYADHESSGFIKWRFYGVLFLAFPLGLFLKGRKIIPAFWVAGILVPVFSLVALEAIHQKMDTLLYLALGGWGLSFTCMQVSILPYVLRNCKPEQHTKAITLIYSTWSAGSIVGGVLIFSLRTVDPELFDERRILQILSVIAFAGMFFLARIRIKENIPAITRKRYDLSDFDWKLIIRAMVPTMILAIGAGLTIPFIGLFFFKIHGIDSDGFSILAAATTVIVFSTIVMVPRIKQRFGYKKAIPISQLLAIAALVLLAITEWYSHLWFAGFLAMACYMLRQPLMNMGAPMTSDLTMAYVGERNREMVSALTASVWSGSWAISSEVFQHLRRAEVSYVSIFLVTAALYTWAVGVYFILILDYEKRKRAGLVD